MIRDAARDGRAILLTTQLLDEAEALCDRLALVRAGTIAAAGTLAELRARARPLLRMTLAFAQSGPDAAAALAGWPCEERVESEGEWRLTVTGSENEWIARVAELAARHPLSRFELSGADLEQIFVEIYGGHSPTGVAS